jgi:uncharacterized integral membrane protein
VKGLVGLGVAVLLAAYAVFLAIANGDQVRVDLLFWSSESLPLYAVVLGSFVLGAAAAGAVASYALLRMRLSLRGERRRASRLEQEVHGLRTLPLLPEAGERAHAKER